MSEEVPPDIVEEFARLSRLYDIEASIQRTPYGYLLKLPPALKEITFTVSVDENQPKGQQ